MAIAFYKGSDLIKTIYRGNDLISSDAGKVDYNLAGASFLLDAYLSGYTLISGTEGTTNIINTIGSLKNIYSGSAAYEETAYCETILSPNYPDTTQIPTSFIRIESNTGVYYATTSPCTTLTGYQSAIYGWDTPNYNTFNVNVSNGFSAVVIARKLNIGGDEGDEALVSFGFDYDSANPTVANARFLQLAYGGNEQSVSNRWYWNNDAPPSGQISSSIELQTFNTSSYTFSAIATSVPNLKAANLSNVTMTDGITYASGSNLGPGGEDLTASTLMNMVVNRDQWEAFYSVGVFIGKDWDIAAILFYDYKLSNTEIENLYNYYKNIRGYDIY